jgi:hypothetical protein
MYKVTLSDGRVLSVNTVSMVKSIIRQAVVYAVRRNGVNISYKFGL